MPGAQRAFPRLLGAGALLLALQVAPSAEAEEPINVNTSDQPTLEELPKVDAELAKRIIDHRDEHGPFEKKDALTRVEGLTPEILAALEPEITLGEYAEEKRERKGSGGD